jgi:hypothetical protein
MEAARKAAAGATVVMRLEVRPQVARPCCAARGPAHSSPMLSPWPWGTRLGD